MASHSHDDVFHALRIIGALHENEKLRTENGVLCIEGAGVLQGLFRRYNGESRERNVAAIARILNNAFLIADSALQREEIYARGVVSMHMGGMMETVASPVSDVARGLPRSVVVGRMGNLQLLARSQREMSGAAAGLRNLSTTYRTDSCTVARIDILLEQTRDRLLLIRQSLVHIRRADISEPMSRDHLRLHDK
jgi:hypothetical protein